MKIGFFQFIIVSLVVLLLFSSCKTWNRFFNPIKINNLSPPVMNFKNVFDVHYEPDTDMQALERSLEKGYIQWLKLKQNFFPESKEKIEIVVYRNVNSYNRHAGRLPVSKARYNFKTNRIYITIATDKKAWRHELVHAFIATQRTASYRIQEGLAYYLQHQNFSDISCSGAGTKANPPEFPRILTLIRNQKTITLDEFFFSKKRKITDIKFAIRSAYYMHFLWQKKSLNKSLLYYTQNPASHFEYETTRADFFRLKKLYKEFNIWLKTPNATRSLSGC